MEKKCTESRNVVGTLRVVDGGGVGGMRIVYYNLYPSRCKALKQCDCTFLYSFVVNFGLYGEVVTVYIWWSLFSVWLNDPN